MLGSFKRKGKASFLVGGQAGSEGKGAAAAFAARHLAESGRHFDIVTTSAGAQAGHTSTHDGATRVVFHLPTAPLISYEYGLSSSVYLNSGAVINPDVLSSELDSWGHRFSSFFIHPNAAIITDECREAEMALDSAQTRIASTRKGVGEAIARRALRSGAIARDWPSLKQYVRRIDLNQRLAAGASVLVEVPQGFSLSLAGKFYPHCTSRNCTAVQGMADAEIHPSFYGETMVVIRTFPIRVGSIRDDAGVVLGESGGCYPDQREISWSELGVRAEITTVTKRVRRVFTFSQQQLIDAMCVLRPGIVYVTFCDYLRSESDVHGIKLAIKLAARAAGMEKEPEICYQYGPTTSDVYDRPVWIEAATADI
jgi:adenylosuccinate synthase